MKLFLIGFMGSGKSYWGKLLAEKLKISCFDLDEKIIEQENKSVSEIFSQQGEEHFRKVEHEMLHDLTSSNESFVMACGGGTPCFFNNIEFMNRKGTTVWINTSVDTLFKRLIGEKSSRPLIRELSDDQLRSYISKKFADRKIYYEQAAITIDDEAAHLDSIIEKVFHA